MKETLTNEERLHVVVLDFEQRQRATQLTDPVYEDPSMAACELIALRDELRKYRAWAESCDPSPMVQAVIAELAAIQPPITDSALKWVRDHCLGLLRGQLDPLTALDVPPPDRHHGGTTIEERDQPPFFDPTGKQP